MFASKRQKRFAKRGRPEVFSIRGAVTLACRQLLLFAAVGLLVWGAHAMIRRNSWISHCRFDKPHADTAGQVDAGRKTAGPRTSEHQD